MSVLYGCPSSETPQQRPISGAFSITMHLSQTIARVS